MMREDKAQALSVPVPSTLEGLLDQLAARTVSGHDAKDLICAFLTRHGIMAHHDKETQRASTSTSTSLTVLDIFFRCLDRNLQAGISQATLRSVMHADDSQGEVQRFLAALHSSGNVSSFPMEMALAHIGSPAKVVKRMQRSAWYASRKVDGVRCVTVVSMDAKSKRITDVHTLSRSGRPLEALAPFRAQLAEDLGAYPRLARLAGAPDASGHAHLVLDGELCALQLAGDDGRTTSYVEDFAHTLSVVRRQTPSTTPIIYFPFDCMPLEAFVCWRTALERDTAPRFSERYASLDALVAWCLAERPATCLRRLEQWRVRDAASLDALVDRAAHAQWEGLMLREDIGYEGRRTQSLLKLRPTQEAEYVVQDVVLASMRLPINGQYAVYEAVSRT